MLAYIYKLFGVCAHWHYDLDLRTHTYVHAVVLCRCYTCWLGRCGSRGDPRSNRPQCWGQIFVAATTLLCNVGKISLAPPPPLKQILDPHLLGPATGNSIGWGSPICFTRLSLLGPGSLYLVVGSIMLNYTMNTVTCLFTDVTIPRYLIAE